MLHHLRPCNLYHPEQYDSLYFWVLTSCALHGPPYESTSTQAWRGSALRNHGVCIVWNPFAALFVQQIEVALMVLMQDGTVLGQATAAYRSGTYVGLDGEVLTLSS